MDCGKACWQRGEFGISYGLQIAILAALTLRGSRQTIFLCEPVESFREGKTSGQSYPRFAFWIISGA